MLRTRLGFSPELAEVSTEAAIRGELNQPITIVASGPGDWEHNCIHLLESSFVLAKALGVSPLEENLFVALGLTSNAIEIGISGTQGATFVDSAQRDEEKKLIFRSERLILVMELLNSNSNPPFGLDFYVGDVLTTRLQLRSRLQAFRGLLSAFIATASAGKASVDFEETMWCLRRAAEGQEWFSRFSK